MIKRGFRLRVCARTRGRPGGTGRAGARTIWSRPARAVTGQHLLADRGRRYSMTFDPRWFGARKRQVGIFLLLLAMLASSVAPVLSAPAPKIVSVDVTGNLRV